MSMTVTENYVQHVDYNMLKKPHVGLENNALNPKHLIGDALHQRVEAIDHELCEPGDEDTFFVADLGEVYRQHLRWKKNLPRIKPFYGKYITPYCLSLACLPLAGLPSASIITYRF